MKIFKVSQKDLVQIDGKWYDNDLNEILTPPASNNVQTIPRFVTITTKYGDKTLTEGAEEDNYFGKFLLLKINDTTKTVSVRCLESKSSSVSVGEEKTYPLLGFAEGILSEKIRQEREMKYSKIDFGKSSEFFTIGYLAKNGRIRVEVPSHLKEMFDKMYASFTGEDPSLFLNHGYATSVDRETSELRMAFPSPGEHILAKMDFSLYPICRDKNNPNRLEMNYYNYVFNLFRLGFTMGLNERNIPKILSRIEGDENKKSFIAGTKLLEDPNMILELDKD